jgi:hypothetical protein
VSIEPPIAEDPDEPAEISGSNLNLANSRSEDNHMGAKIVI